MREISAGGIVYRKQGQQVQLLLIEDRQGRYTFPKGKTEPGETAGQTALREIREETGLTGEIRGAIGEVHYKYSLPEAGVVNKTVHYFLVEAEAGQLSVQEEEICGAFWTDASRAWDKQLRNGYDNNIPVMKEALRILGVEVEG